MEINNNDKFESDDLDDIIDQFANQRTSFSFTFEEFWKEVEAFAEQNRLSTGYVEDEFILDGELVPVHLQWQDELNEELWKARIDEHDKFAEEEAGGESPTGDPDLDKIVYDILKQEGEDGDDWMYDS